MDLVTFSGMNSSFPIPSEESLRDLSLLLSEQAQEFLAALDRKRDQVCVVGIKIARNRIASYAMKLFCSIYGTPESFERLA